MSTVDPGRRVALVLESIFPPVRGGGAESQVATLAGYFAAHGLEPLVIVPMVREGSQIAAERVDGIEVVRIAYPRVRWLGGVLMLWGLARLLVRRRREYGAIHAHIANHMAAVCCVVGRVLGKPVTVKLTGWHEMELGILARHRRDPVTALLRWAMRRATWVQAISGRLQALLLERGFEKGRVLLIPNAVDTRRFHVGHDRAAVRRELGLGDEAVGIFVGRLVPEKGLVPFLESWFSVVSAETPVVALIVGAGDLEATLVRMIAVAGREHQVRLTGVRKDVERLLSAADFGLLPSLHEGLSNSLLEFMAAGLPVLGSRVSGTEDLIRHGETGWLFSATDRGEIESSLAEAVATPARRLGEMGRRARDVVEAYAGIDGVAARLARLYGMELSPEPSAAAR